MTRRASELVIRTLIVPVVLLLMGSARPVSAPEQVTVIYSGSLLGELEPCGCTREGDLGGIRRNATVVDTLRAEQPDLFLISPGGLFGTQLPAHRITNHYILTGLAELGFDAIGVQWGDLVYGMGFLQGTPLPLVGSNWLGEEFLEVRKTRRGGKTLAYFQWLPPQQSPYRRMRGEHDRVTGKTAALAMALAQARAEGLLTVLGTTLPAAQAKQDLPMDDVDVLIAPWGRERFGEPEQVGKTLILIPGARGQRLGRLELTLGAEGRIAQWRHEVISLPETVPDAPRMAPWYAAYTEALRQDHAERVARAKQVAGDSFYVGSEGCSVCHGQAFAIWKGSPHARAFAALEAVDKSFDANCIGCHTVGFGQPGGFIDPVATEHLLDVGCEACHGPGKTHAESGGTAALGANAGSSPPVCQRCHNRAHSPSFEFESYWKRIRHGQEAQVSAAHGRIPLWARLRK